MVNRVARFAVFLLALFAMQLVGCSEKQNEQQSQQQSEPLGQYEQSRERLRKKYMEDLQNERPVKKPETKQDAASDSVKNENKNSTGIPIILSAVECYMACQTIGNVEVGDSSITVYRNDLACKKYCKAFEKFIPVNACNRACLDAGDEFINRSGYIMDRSYFSRFVLEICDEECPCASRYDSVAYKKNIGRILDSLMGKGVLDSVVYEKNTKAVKRIKKCHKTKNAQKCREEQAEYDRNRLKALKECGME